MRAGAALGEHGGRSHLYYGIIELEIELRCIMPSLPLQHPFHLTTNRISWLVLVLIVACQYQMLAFHLNKRRNLDVMLFSERSFFVVLFLPLIFISATTNHPARLAQGGGSGGGSGGSSEGGGEGGGGEGDGGNGRGGKGGGGDGGGGGGDRRGGDGGGEVIWYRRRRW